jgi:hypothetical protein
MAAHQSKKVHKSKILARSSSIYILQLSSLAMHVEKASRQTKAFMWAALFCSCICSMGTSSGMDSFAMCHDSSSKKYFRAHQSCLAQWKVRTARFWQRPNLSLRGGRNKKRIKKRHEGKQRGDDCSCARTTTFWQEKACMYRMIYMHVLLRVQTVMCMNCFL